MCAIPPDAGRRRSDHESAAVAKFAIVTGSTHSRDGKRHEIEVSPTDVDGSDRYRRDAGGCASSEPCDYKPDGRQKDGGGRCPAKQVHAEVIHMFGHDVPAIGDEHDEQHERRR